MGKKQNTFIDTYDCFLILFPITITDIIYTDIAVFGADIDFIQIGSKLVSSKCGYTIGISVFCIIMSVGIAVFKGRNGNPSVIASA